MGLDSVSIDRPHGRWWSIAADSAAALSLLFLSLVFNKLLPLRDAVVTNATSYNVPIPPEEPGWVMVIFIWILPLVLLSAFLLLIHRRSFKVIQGLMGWFFTMSIVIFFTSMIRYFLSSPRPYYATVCQPRADTGTLLSSTLCVNKVTDKAIRSFPSGHTSLIWASWMYIGVYLGIITNTFRNKGHFWKVPVFFLITTIPPISMMLERVSSGNHHWSDVIAGMIIGWVSVTLVLLNLSNTGKEVKEVEQDQQVV